MKVTKLNNIAGFCNNCGKAINAGYLYQQTNGEVFKVLCEDCFLAEEQNKKKSQKVVLKEVSRGLIVSLILALFNIKTSKLYEVISCEDPFLPKFLTLREVNDMLERGDNIKIYK